MKLTILGDSTSGVKLGEIDENTAGWAEYVNDYLDSGSSVNKCVVGWGIRDFFNRGQVSWVDHTLSKLDENDTILACFGTLERSPLSRTDFGGFGARGSLFGQHDRFKIVYDEHYKVEYKVYTFGEYLRRLAILCRVKGVKLCLLSQIPRNTWENGHHKRTYSIQYAKIMETISKEMNVGFLDTNEFLSAFLEEIGQDAAQELYSLTDKSHTSPKGARVYAQMIVNKLEL